MFWGAVMVFSCRSPVHDEHVPHHFHTPEDADFKTRLTVFGKVLWHFVPPLVPKRDHLYAARWGIRISKVVAIIVVIVFMVLSEVQIHLNLVLSGENQLWSFSQVRKTSSGT